MLGRFRQCPTLCEQYWVQPQVSQITHLIIGAGAPGIVIVFTTCIVNLRHILYSGSVAPYLNHLGRRWRCLLAYLLTDEVYAVTITRFVHEAASPSRSPFLQWYFLGAGLAVETQQTAARHRR